MSTVLACNLHSLLDGSAVAQAVVVTLDVIQLAIAPVLVATLQGRGRFTGTVVSSRVRVAYPLLLQLRHVDEIQRRSTLDIERNIVAATCRRVLRCTVLRVKIIARLQKCGFQRMRKVVVPHPRQSRLRYDTAVFI